MPPKKSAKATRPRVYARIRPMFGRDAGQPELFNITDTTLSYEKEEGAQPTMFQLDKVFNMESRQEDVFETIGEVALSSLRQGFNSTVLAYGQTGSGKTFSMEGAKDGNGKYTSEGLIPRLFKSVFELFNNDEDLKSNDKGQKQFTVTLQFIELYNEQLQARRRARPPAQKLAARRAAARMTRSPESLLPTDLH